MSELRSMIERGEYEIDSERLADEILAKLGIIRRARRLLEASRASGPEPARRPRLRSGRFRLEPEPELGAGRGTGLSR